jgi:hypothetical protein
VDRELEAVTAKKPARAVGQITAARRPDDTDARATARAVLHPTTSAAIATQATYGTTIDGKLLDMGALAEELGEQVGKVHGGDMRRMESMLVAQATTLDALFNRLTHRAMAQEYLKQFETYMRLALKAQAQARATVEALAEIKNPRPVAFVQQANVGTNLMVNNNGISRAHTENAQTGLLEADDGNRLDAGTAGTAGRIDPALATVEPLDRADDRRR